jgi:catechol 2,3-dioxygenase-like lactoylglutathione lyase family enzyme
MVRGVLHSSITVSNLDRAVRFYSDVLGMELVSIRESGSKGLSEALRVPDAQLKIGLMRAGEDFVELIEYVNPKPPPKMIAPCDVGGMHIAFQVEDIEALGRKLKEYGCAFNTPPRLIEEGPMKGWYWAYFRDPDGSQLEAVELRRL